MSSVLVIDFGSQTTMLIARRIREQGVLAKIVPASISAPEVIDENPCALILSGGPASLSNQQELRLDRKILQLNIPVLGVCYGMQSLVDHFGGAVTKALHKEFGERYIDINENSPLFAGIKSPLKVWMSHSDQVDLKNTKFKNIAKSASCPHAAIEMDHFFGVQFHPEVSHGDHGDKIFGNFIFDIAGAKKNFSVDDFMNERILSIRQTVGDDHVIMGLSGGVDSSVAALLIHRAIGKNLHSVYVNHGLHRLGEIEEVTLLFGDIFNGELHVVDAREQFFKALAGVSDPEAKRKIIGRVFIDVFEAEAKRFSSIKFLGQGTLYSDVIESRASHVIKSHHNVGGLPKRMNLKLLEPLSELFKDEVQQLGIKLGLPSHIVNRQPFPGPGLAVRMPGAVTKERALTLQKADAIVREEIDGAILRKEMSQLWQWFAILLPVKSVGVMGDARAYGETVVIRCVESRDAMTADWAKLSYQILAQISARITNEVEGVCRVLYDITQKPPGTIEWE